MVRSLGPAQGPRLLWLPAWYLPQDTGGELDHQLPPLPEQGGQLSIRKDLDAEVTAGNRDVVRDTQRQYTSTGTVDTSTREIGVPGDTWRREELGYVRP